MSDRRKVKLNLDLSISDLVAIADTLYASRDWNTGTSKEDKMRIAKKIQSALNETKVDMKKKGQHDS